MSFISRRRLACLLSVASLLATAASARDATPVVFARGDDDLDDEFEAGAAIPAAALAEERQCSGDTCGEAPSGVTAPAVSAAPTQEAALDCLPHLCSKAELAPARRAALLQALRDDLDLVLASGEMLVGDGSDGMVPGPALLITCGGPERAESIVQAHVLISTVRQRL
jgi:hypothetical protein